MTDIARARRTVVARILEGGGMASHADRRTAFDNARLSEPLRTLIEKVVKHAHRVTDEDFDAAKAAGLTEDQLFEVVVCAAVGQASRQYDAALAALELASNERSE